MDGKVLLVSAGACYSAHCEVGMVSSPELSQTEQFLDNVMVPLRLTNAPSMMPRSVILLLCESKLHDPSCNRRFTVHIHGLDKCPVGLQYQ